MPSNSILHYLYKRNHTWWFRKRFVSEGNAIEYRLSLHTASFQNARLARNTRHLLEVSEYLQGKGVALNILNIGINTATPTG